MYSAGLMIWPAMLVNTLVREADPPDATACVAVATSAACCRDSIAWVSRSSESMACNIGQMLASSETEKFILKEVTSYMYLCVDVERPTIVCSTSIEDECSALSLVLLQPVVLGLRLTRQDSCFDSQDFIGLAENSIQTANTPISNQTDLSTNNYRIHLLTLVKCFPI